ncbi:ethanolaminephosphotransferase 1 [Culicoides brevitarsis]|uniref:ethanolaminephosphotransferase 1 n=1 Tax=Culicoides brevitarsis TaxID=469753 RepID=UPI00307C924C
MDVKYLTEEHLKGFDNYKYSAIDTSPLSIYVMHPFWNRVVLLCPKWIAPNVLTFVGFLFTVLNFVLLSYYDYHFYASTELEGATPIPNWVWLAAAINIFLAYTLDGIDGKQARRIGLSGPLGELFDHGLDSYTAPLIPACLYSIFGRLSGSVAPLRMYYVVWTVLFSFYASHWEKYNTGVLYLPWGYDWGMWASTFMYLVTWFSGYEMWKRNWPLGLKPGFVMEFLLHVSALGSIPIILYNIYQSYVDKTGKMRKPMEALRPLFSFGIFMGISLAWAHLSPTNILETHPRAVYLLSGTIFSNISCRLIVSQMSNTRCEALHWMSPILFVAMLISFMIPRLETIIIYLLLIGSTLAHWHYGTMIVQQLCVHFNRICFKVTKATPSKNN